MTNTTETLYISYDHRSYAVTIERKAVKNITLRLYRHGTLKLSAAPDVPMPHLQDFLLRHSRRIFAALTRLQSMPQSPAITLQDGESLRLGGLPYTLSWCTGTQNRVKKAVIPFICILRTGNFPLVAASITVCFAGKANAYSPTASAACFRNFGTMPFPFRPSNNVACMPVGAPA